jgi:exodeoxyribonuclease VII small subunit
LSQGIVTESSEDNKGRFEAALARLQEIVDRLEGGEMPLEAAVGLFEEGMVKSQECMKLLEAARARVEQLAGEGHDNFRTTEFDA